MQNRLSLLLGAALLSVASLAAAVDLPLVGGKVEKIDLDTKKVTLTHENIPNLKMKAMAMMPYAVKNPDDLKKLHVGDKVKFSADRVGTVYTVIRIDVVK